MKVISVCSTKGGVGKTTLTANLAAVMSHPQKRVLMIDADPQASLSYYYPLRQSPDSTNGLRQFLTAEQACVPIATQVEGVDMIVSDDPEARLENRLLHLADGRFRMLAALRHFQDYDYILIDTPGAVSILVENAMLAADICLSPLPPEILSAQEFMRGIVQMAKLLQKMSAFGIAPGDICALIYKHDRTRDARFILGEIKKMFDDAEPSPIKVKLLRHRVPARVVYRAAATAGIPVHQFEPKRHRGESAKTTMENIKNEIMNTLATGSEKLS